MNEESSSRSLPPGAPELPAVADHEVLRRIGVGAYGEVWLARSVTGIYRAVKVVRQSHFEHKRTYDREFAGLQKFEPVSRRHDGLVDVLQIGRDERAGCFYYVMELADHAGPGEPGGSMEGYRALTLTELLRQSGRLAPSRCAHLGTAIAEALGFLHSCGLVHRDVKPSNIIQVGGRLKLADVGLVTGLGEARSFVGTEGFIAPEGPGSPQSDIYSLGKVLYEAVTGKSRLDYPDLPEDLSPLDESESFAEINEIILRACAPDPASRHATAEELRDELILVQAGRSVRRLRRNERLMAVWRRVGIAACFAGLAMIAGWRFEHQRADAARDAAAAEARQRQVLQEREQAARQALYAADMNLAQQALESGNFGRAEELLTAYRPQPGGGDLRGLEWYYYWRRVRGDSLGVLRGHEHVVSSLAASRDGKRLFSASFDQTVREWSLPDRRELRRWTLPGCLFGSIDLDPSEQHLAAEDGNRPLSALLDLKAGTWVTNVSSPSLSIAFAPQGEALVRGARALLFDTNGVIEVMGLDFKVSRVLSEAGGRLLFSPQGRTLATGPSGDTIRLWSWPELAPTGSLTGAGTLLGMSFSPDGNRLAGTSRDGRLKVWDVQTRELQASRTVHEGTVTWTVAYSPDGSRLATGGNDQTIRIHDAATLRELHVFRGHGSEVWAVLWSRDGHRLYSASKDSTIRVWDADPAPVPREIPGAVRPVVFSSDERLAAVVLRTGDALVCEVATGKAVQCLKGVVDIGGFAPDGSSLTLLAEGWVWERRAVEDGARLESRQLIAPTNSFSCRLLSPDGRWLATGLRDGRAFIHDTHAGGKATLLEGHRETILAFAFSPDSSQLLCGTIDRAAILWDLKNRRHLRTLIGHRMSVGGVAFSADGARVATSGWDDSVRLWEASTGREVAVFGGHEGGAQAVAFAPCGLTLVSLAGNSMLKFWSLGTGREAGTLRLQLGSGHGWLSVSPRGRWLAAVSQAEVLTFLSAPRSELESSR